MCVTAIGHVPFGTLPNIDTPDFVGSLTDMRVKKSSFSPSKN